MLVHQPHSECSSFCCDLHLLQETNNRNRTEESMGDSTSTSASKKNALEYFRRVQQPVGLFLLVPAVHPRHTVSCVELSHNAITNTLKVFKSPLRRTFQTAFEKNTQHDYHINQTASLVCLCNLLFIFLVTLNKCEKIGVRILMYDKIRTPN